MPQNKYKYFNEQLPTGGKALFVAGDTRRDLQFKRAKPVDVGDKYADIVDPAQGVFIKAVIANTLPDRHRDYFTLEALAHFVPQIKAGNVALQLFHDDEKIVGRLVDAEVKQMEGGLGYELEAILWVMSSAVLPDQPDITVANAATSGLLKHVSVGFTGMMYKLVERGEGMPSLWEVSPNPAHIDGGLLFETSFVNMGAQIGAEIKDAKSKPERAKFKNMKAQFHIKGVSHTIEATPDEGGNVNLKGLDEFAAAFSATVNEVQEANQKALALESEIEALRKRYTADVVNYSKDSKAAITAEDAAKMSLADLISKAHELTATTNEVADTNTKGYKNPYL